MSIRAEPLLDPRGGRPLSRLLFLHPRVAGITPEGRGRFLAAAFSLVSLKPAQTDRAYDVYVHPALENQIAR